MVSDIAIATPNAVVFLVGNPLSVSVKNSNESVGVGCILKTQTVHHIDDKRKRREIALCSLDLLPFAPWCVSFFIRKKRDVLRCRWHHASPTGLQLVFSSRAPEHNTGPKLLYFRGTIERVCFYSACSAASHTGDYGTNTSKATSNRKCNQP